MSHELSFRGFFDLARRQWRTFAVVAVAAIVLSTILSSPWFITPKYRSMATVYPVNLNPYSTETRTDQLLQLLESNSIRDTLIVRFDLGTVYEADTNARGGYFALYNEFKDRVTISKTRYESVMIEVLDEDPRRARDMVNAMLDQVNLLARRLQREKSYEVLAIAERAMQHERAKLDSVEKRLDDLRQETGLLSYDYQVRELTRGLMGMIQSGAPQSRLDEVRRMIKDLQDKGGEFHALSELSEMFRANYDRLLGDYERVVNDVTKELTYTNVVVYPEVSDKKVYPIRWLIVVLSTLSALFLCFVLLVWRDQSR
jgi:capsule polysaccharide export protein KpsE/RkpR